MPSYSKNPGIRVEYSAEQGVFLLHLVSRREDDFRFVRDRVLKPAIQAGRLATADHDTGPNGTLAFRLAMTDEEDSLETLPTDYACQQLQTAMTQWYKDALAAAVV